ncbi:MAG: hypothetical protein PHC33_00255 [Candidatus Omnitrophica bacterium]|nr:hypothetical protein [Candidatus Omnitrophota bacterium]
MDSNNFYVVIEDICERDKRYKPDSYEFVMEGVRFSQLCLKKTGHVSGRELSEGLRELAVKKFGPMAKSVLQYWGITRTEDIGNIVFNMIDKKILQKTETDTLDDFRDVYSFEEAFKNVLSDITLAE